MKNMIQNGLMRFSILLASLTWLGSVAWGAEPHKDDLQRGIYEQEINHNTNAAIVAYEQVIHDFDAQKAMAKVAVTRLSELQSRNGNEPQARALRERLASEFADRNGSVASLSTNKQSGSGFGVSPRANLLDRPTLDAQTYQSRQQILEQLKRESGSKRRIFAVQTGYGDLGSLMESINQLEAKIADMTPDHDDPAVIKKEQAKLKNAEDQMDLHVNAMIKILELQQATVKPLFSEAKVLFFGAGARGNSLTIPGGQKFSLFEGVYKVGISEFANVHKVKLYRKTKDGKVEVTTFDMDEIRDKHPEKDEVLQDGDRIEVPERHVVF